MDRRASRPRADMDPAKSFMVMEFLLKDLHKLAETPGPMWESICCSRKVAYGCGKHGQKLVEGLTLYVRRAVHPDLTSSMSVRLSDEGFRSIEAELRVPRIALEAQGSVRIASEGLLVLIVIFRVRDQSRRDYYLVYDSTNASLSMIPCLPSRFVASYTATPVPRRIGGDGQDPQLVLMAHRFWPQRVNREFLCLWSPAMSDITEPWDLKVRRFPEISGAFYVNAMFSFKGKVFWADLSRGLAYCDLSTGNSTVQFDFIDLPYGYQILSEDFPADEEAEPPEINRTIGCIGGCIKFICINRPRGHPGNVMVNVWTLDLGCKEWKAEKGLLWKEFWKELWKQNHYIMGMDAELWEIEPRYPVLMPDDTLSLVLWDMRQSSRMGHRVEADSICRFDMFTKRLLWYGTVRDYHIMWSTILPGNFFTKCYPTVPCNSKLPERKRKLQSTVRRHELPQHKRKLRSTVSL